MSTSRTGPQEKAEQGSPADERPPTAAPGHRRWGPVLVVGVVVVAVLAAVAVFVLPDPVQDRPLDEVAGPAPAPALTTSTDPAEALRQLADRAAAQPPVAGGRFDYVHTREWDRPRDPATNQFIPDLPESQHDSQRWRGAGPGRVVAFVDEEFQFDQEVPAQRPLTDLPTEPDALERDLLTGEPSVDVWPSGPCFAMRDLWEGQVVEPQVQAAFLRLLASKDRIRLVGPVHDRLDRQGIAVEVTEPAALGPTADAQKPDFVHALILDPQTGSLLSWDSILVGGGGDPLIHVDTESGVVNVGLTTWVSTGRVGSVDERP
jgi:hypothetical protein